MTVKELMKELIDSNESGEVCIEVEDDEAYNGFSIRDIESIEFVQWGAILKISEE